MGYGLKEFKLFDLVCGYDVDSNHLKEALKLGIIDRATQFEEAKECDTIIIATPVETIAKILQELKNVAKNQTIIDLGSTKEELIKNTPPSIRKNYVATHPMCGTEKHGPGAAMKDLYKNKVVVFCNIEDSGERQYKEAKRIFEALGSKIVYMDAKDHDKHAAFISHLPHAISFALANSVLAQEDPKSILTLAAGGFKDMSRVAKSSPSMWKDIFKQNRGYILNSLDSYIKELSLLKGQIQQEDWEGVREFIQRANRLESIL